MNKGLKFSVTGNLLVGALFTALLSSSVSAQNLQNEAAIDLQQAITKTLTDNPGLIAFGYQLRAQDARVLQAGIRPVPELLIQVENILGSGESDLLAGAQSTLSIAWVIERGLLQKRVGAARAGASLLKVDIDIRRLDAAAETARRYLECLDLQTRMVNALEGIQLIQDTVTAIEQRVIVGRAPTAELARVRVELARRELNRKDIEHELLSAYYRLAAQWGKNKPDFSNVNGDIFNLPEIDSFDILIQKLNETPDISRFMAQQRLDNARLRLEQQKNKSSWRVSAGIRRIESSSDHAFVADLTIPLSKGNSNRGRVAEARANSARTLLEEKAERVRIETALFVFYQELQHNIDLAEVLENQIIPLTEQALEETQSAYRQGRYSYLEFSSVLSELLAARNDLVEASIGAHRNLIEIERFTGRSLVSPQRSP